MIKKPAETEVPMIPPILLKALNFALIPEAVAAITMLVTMTIPGELGRSLRIVNPLESARTCSIDCRRARHVRGMTEGKESAYGDGALTRSHKTAGHEINCLALVSVMDQSSGLRITLLRYGRHPTHAWACIIRQTI